MNNDWASLLLYFSRHVDNFVWNFFPFCFSFSSTKKRKERKEKRMPNVQCFSGKVWKDQLRPALVFLISGAGVIDQLWDGSSEMQRESWYRRAGCSAHHCYHSFQWVRAGELAASLPSWYWPSPPSNSCADLGQVYRQCCWAGGGGAVFLWFEQQPDLQN